MVVVVFALFTACVTPGDVLLLKLASPLYVATIVLLPAVVEVSVQLALPPLSEPVVQPSTPSVIATVPVGVPDPLVFATLATTVYPWPTTVGADRSVVIVVVVPSFGVREKFFPLTVTLLTEKPAEVCERSLGCDTLRLIVAGPFPANPTERE
jgi:hypothetical protein